MATPSQLPEEYQIKSSYPELPDRSKKELNNLLKFFSKCIFKNTEEADKYETLDSSRLSYEMITAWQYQAPYDTNLAARQTFLESYQEKNQYYLNYLVKIGYRNPKTGEILVPRLKMVEAIVIARGAANNEIIWYEDNVLNAKDTRKARSIYTESLLYYNAILHNEGFAMYEKYWNYTNFIVSLMAMERMITERFFRIFDIDEYDERELRNAFASYGLEFFENMPDKYRRRLLKNLNLILQNKGTNQAFVIIANIFGFDNVQIFKYFLVKNFRRDNHDKSIINLRDKTKSPYPELFFAEVPYVVEDIEGAFLNPETRYYEYNNFTSPDPLWQAKEEEVATHHFNYIYTKYLSMNVALDMVDKNINIPAFYSFLKGFKTDISDSFKLGLDFFISDLELSSAPIHLADIITAMQILVLDILGYDDTIVKDWQSIAYLKYEPKVNGFESIHNLLDKTEANYYYSNGTIIEEDGTIHYKDGTTLDTHGTTYNSDGSTELPDGNKILSNKNLLKSDSKIEKYTSLTYFYSSKTVRVEYSNSSLPTYNGTLIKKAIYTDKTYTNENRELFYADGKLVKSYIAKEVKRCYTIYESSSQEV